MNDLYYKIWLDALQVMNLINYAGKVGKEHYCQQDVWL